MITEFLEARYAEDAERAYSYREVEPEPGRRFRFTVWPSEQEVEMTFEDGSRRRLPWSDFQEQHMERFLARPRVLVEVAAKRQIVALHQLAEGPTYRQTECCARCTANGEYPADDAYTDEQNWPCPTLRALASVYSDHPDYDQAWRVA